MSPQQETSPPVAGLIQGSASRPIRHILSALDLLLGGNGASGDDGATKEVALNMKILKTAGEARQAYLKARWEVNPANPSSGTDASAAARYWSWLGTMPDAAIRVTEAPGTRAPLRLTGSHQWLVGAGESPLSQEEGRLADASADPLLGQLLGGYRIIDVLGRGGFSVVYRAEQIALQREVALKVLSADRYKDPVFRERFLRETHTAAQLEHPNIAAVYDAGEAGGRFFIATRLVRGTDLKAILRTGPLAPDRALSLLAQVARALDYAHQSGFVHRDVKPANILVADTQGDAEEYAFLSDFGLTKGSESAAITTTGQFMGTPAYAAPEQLRGEAVDRKADIYSLGCVLFECLTGSPPFDKPADWAVVHAHMFDPPPALSSEIVWAPLEATSVLQRAMAKVSADRQANCVELVAELQREFNRPVEPDIPESTDPEVPRRKTEADFNRAMVDLYERAKRETGYVATRFIQMVADQGGLAVARQLIRASTPSDGFTALWERRRLDLTVESLALQPKFQHLFTGDELELAQRRLEDYGHQTDTRDLENAGPQTEPNPPAEQQLTLHQAMIRVLREAGGRGMTATELAGHINTRRLYVKRDGTPVASNQIHARAGNYPLLFRKAGGGIRLAQPGDSI